MWLIFGLETRKETRLRGGGGGREERRGVRGERDKREESIGSERGVRENWRRNERRDVSEE